MTNLGERLKQYRLRAGLSVRALARQADLSPSFISQIENGKSRPSVGTLYSFAQLLNVPIDELFEEHERGPGNSSDTDAEFHPAEVWKLSEYSNRVSVVHPSHRPHLAMAEGVDWERLAATSERGINFMKITYAPGASSQADGALVTHHGYEYGYVLRGQLEVTVGDEVFILNAGESLGFDSTIPHRLRNCGTDVFEGVWFMHASH
ncbi:helix-turn-helix domain-containing protein [Sinomonas soli]